METRTAFSAEVEGALKADFRVCTDCGICTAICPARPFMEFAPMRMVQLLLLDARDRLVAAPDAFACTNCGYCTQYCPVSLPVAEFVDFLRDEVRKDGANTKRQKQEKYTREVLKNLDQWGRLEAGDLGWANATTKGGGGIFGVFGRGEKRQPLNVIRDVPSVFDFLKRLRGEPVEPPAAKEKDRKGKRR
jgi:heterodisulfide reductase subunit C